MKGWKDIIRQIAPTIGAGLGGPLAGTATKFVAEKLLGKTDAGTPEIEAAIVNASPDQLAKLKELDQEFQAEMKKLDVDVFKLEVEDRSSARDLFKVNIWPQIVLSAVFVVGYFGVLFYLFGGGNINQIGTNDWAQGVFTTILGVLTAAIPQILGFWFGSSLGSKEKTRGLQGAAPTPPKA